MKKKISLKDIAQKVGVSTALVSYVLNDQKLDRISKEVAQRIREVAKQMNYTTNLLAKSLKTRKTFTIGLLVADISNPFFSALARIIEDEAAKCNYTVIFGSSDESPEKALRLIQVLINRQVDGLIVAVTDKGEPQINFLREHDIPFVLIDRYFPQVDACYVAIDNYQAAYELVSHVLNQGYSRIGFITYQTTLFHLQERKRGYLAALQEHNLPVEQEYIKMVSLASTEQEVDKAINELLLASEPIEAIIFAANILSTFGLRCLNALPIKVPDELVLASFDESDASYLFYAPLTHIRQPLKTMGEHAVQLLVEKMEGRHTAKSVKVKAELIIGKSTRQKI